MTPLSTFCVAALVSFGITLALGLILVERNPLSTKRRPTTKRSSSTEPA